MSRFKDKFHTDVPKGCLYYPSCGSDTIEPLALFNEDIKEYHFSDVREFGLPELHNEEHNTNRRPSFIRSHSLEENLFNEYSIKHYSVTYLDSDEKEYNELIEKASKLSEKVFVSPRHPLIYKEVWQKKSDTLSITWHKYDGVAALMNINQIAVFFYRGDSIGEGGSGQWWLGEQLFNTVLDKLVDGGIIITDGSNPDPNWRDREWKELYRHSQEGRWSDLTIIEPKNFTYRNRTFTCLGPIGKRYGTVYVWKVMS